jgi:tripeptide aminopeptidase
MEGMMSDVVERFLRYVRVDTQSDLDSKTFPSTAKQFDLARLLEKELRELGLEDVSVDENGYVMATLPANVKGKVPVIGLIAHMDTSPEMNGANVNPHIVEHYDGGDIHLDGDKEVVLSPRDFPELLKYKGQTLITTDGSSLLGADDKAGVAEIMAVLKTLVTNPEIRHGTVKIGFTPDEEVGHGADRFDVAKFGADLAYTLDGGEVGEFQYESFNAAQAIIHIKGRSVHPGEAKNKMVNAILIATELVGMFPAGERPEHVEGYEGYFHFFRFNGGVDEVEMYCIIRDFNRAKFERRKALFMQAIDYLKASHPACTIQVDLKDQYYNMREKIEPVRKVIDVALQAMQAVGVKPHVIPIRGGTDGSRISYMGLPTPNLFTGGHNFHGRYEYIPVPSMEKAVEVAIKILEIFASPNPKGLGDL